MFALLGIAARVVNLAAAATTVLVAVKHAWDVWQVAEAERERRTKREENP